jgi:hypothetical protein
VADLRERRVCELCGRGIVLGHNLSSLNYEAHSVACRGQQTRRWMSAHRRSVAVSARIGIGSRILPTIGQLGFPFDDVPEELV